MVNKLFNKYSIKSSAITVHCASKQSHVIYIYGSVFVSFQTSRLRSRAASELSHKSAEERGMLSVKFIDTYIGELFMNTKIIILISQLVVR